ncbi:AAA family ATPase [Tolypothrix campylonemoides VB511288_2]|uniref:AAA+ ATPase domain-containing protein n=3 Tax=Nostocales TaxID=1161 RepID=A0A0C1RAF7_9CYAN
MVVAVSTTPQVNRTRTAVPILWVKDIIEAQCLNKYFHLAEYKDVSSDIPDGYHYILVEKGTPEAVIKAVAWHIRAAGYEARVYSLATCYQLANIAGNMTAAAELMKLIIEFSLSYKDWAERNNENLLTLQEASDVAYTAIALLSDPQRSIELGTLRTRCKESSYDWNKLMSKLEEEFRREVARRQGKDLPTSKAELLKLELLALLKEEDPIARTFKRNELCGKFSISGRDIDQLLSTLETANRTPKAKRFGASEFRALEPEGLTWLIPGLLPSKGLTVLGGSPGVGKTTLAYDAAAAVLFGESFLGEAPTTTGSVLFVASDELPAFVQDKMVNRGIFGSDAWSVLLDWDISQMNALEESIADTRPALVVIDSFASIHKDATFDENSAQARRSIVALEALLNRYNAAGLLIHHTTKSKEQTGVGKLRGSTAIAAAASVVWLLEGDGKSEVRSFTTPKIRGASPLTLQLTLDAPNGRWEAISGDSEEGTHKTIGDRIIEFFNSDPDKRFSAEEIISAVGYGKQSVYKALDRLVQRGIAFKRPCKIDTRRKVYGLVHGQTPPPSPPLPLKMSTKISETITVEELGSSRQIVDNYSTDSRQSTEPMSNENAKTINGYSVQEILDNSSPQERGGGGEPPGCNESQDTSTVSPTEIKARSEEKENYLQFQAQPQPDQQDEAISLLMVEETGGDIAPFVGCQIEVRSQLTGEVKFSGEMTSYNSKNGFITVATPDGDRIASFKEAIVI